MVPPPGVAALSVRIGVSVHQFRTAASKLPAVGQLGVVEPPVEAERAVLAISLTGVGGGEGELARIGVQRILSTDRKCPAVGERLGHLEVEQLASWITSRDNGIAGVGREPLEDAVPMACPAPAGGSRPGKRD